MNIDSEFNYLVIEFIYQYKNRRKNHIIQLTPTFV